MFPIFSWMLPATGNNTLCLCPKHCSQLETDTPVSAIWSPMGREVWEGNVLLAVWLPLLNSVSCPSCHLVPATTVSRHGVVLYFPSVFYGSTHGGQSWMSWIMLSSNWGNCQQTVAGGPHAGLGMFLCWLWTQNGFYIFIGLFKKKKKVISQAISM